RNVLQRDVPVVKAPREVSGSEHVPPDLLDQVPAGEKEQLQGIEVGGERTRSDSSPKRVTAKELLHKRSDIRRLASVPGALCGSTEGREPRTTSIPRFGPHN